MGQPDDYIIIDGALRRINYAIISLQVDIGILQAVLVSRGKELRHSSWFRSDMEQLEATLFLAEHKLEDARLEARRYTDAGAREYE